jgi:hypothetical protein
LCMHKKTKSMKLCHLLKHKSLSEKNFRASDEYKIRSVEKLIIHQNAEDRNHIVICSFCWLRSIYLIPIHCSDLWKILNDPENAILYYNRFQEKSSTFIRQKLCSF